MIDIPARYSMNRSAADMAYLTTMSKIVYPPVRPSAPFYPKSPYAGLGSLRGNCTIPGPPYCGDSFTYDDELAMFGVEDCNALIGSNPTATDVANQWACTQRNLPKMDLLQNFQYNFQSGCCYPPGYVAGAPIPNQGFQPYTGTGGAGGTVLTGGTSTGGGTPRVTFTTSRGSNTLQPGDTWTIQITGGCAGCQVNVVGGQNGQNIQNTMGVTDSSGNWSMTGTVSTSDIGTWSEAWSVASVPAGSFTFTVVSGSAPAPSGGTGSGTTYHPTVRFMPSRPGTLIPGDTWTIQVTGGAPNASVSVTGGQNGQNITNTMGTTDQNGNWSTQGTVDTSSIGVWQETWYVAGTSAGSFSFTVGGQTNGTPAASGASPSGGGTPTGTTTTPAGSTNLALPSTIGGIPTNYVLMGGAAILLLSLVGGRR